MKRTRKDIQQNNIEVHSDDIDKTIEDYKYVLDSINSWITSADNKVSIYCGMYSLVIAVVAFVASHLISALNIPSGNINNTAYCWFKCDVALALIGFVVSIILYTCAVKPNLVGKKNSDKNKALSLFYKDIAELDKPEDFMNLVLESDRKTYLKSLASEIYYNSKVCTTKMIKFQIAVIASAVTIFFTVVACIAYYFALKGC